jgi:phospholipase/carboxylesterase
MRWTRTSATVLLMLVGVLLCCGCKGAGTTEVIHGVRMLRILPRAVDPTAPLVVALHGWSGDAEGYGRAWREIGLELAAPEGFIPLARGFSWFDWPGGLSEEQLAERVNGAADRLWPAIAKIASGRKVIVIGSSQGAMLAYALAARHPEEVAHAFPISGSAPSQIFLPGRVPAPVHAVHGTEDRVIPIELDRSTIRAFKEHGGVAELEELPGVGHAFTKDIRHHALEHLQSILVAGRLDAGSTQPVSLLRDR